MSTGQDTTGTGTSTDTGIRLNLGCCDRHIPGFINIDIVPPADELVDLSDPWPWPRDSVTEVLALDICEHIPDFNHLFTVDDDSPEGCRLRHKNGRIFFMNELHRILIPGGIATIETPNAAHGSGFFQDPTHISPWCLSTFKYFESGAFAHQRLSKSYGITAAFEILELNEFSTRGEDPRETVWKIKAVLRAVK
jgi:hypothetical protein